MSWIKNLVLLSVSIGVCYCVLLLGDWFLSRQINLAIMQQIENSEARKINGANNTHQNLTANANNFAITPAFASAFTPNVPATKPPIPTAAVLSPDL